MIAPKYQPERNPAPKPDPDGELLPVDPAPKQKRTGRPMKVWGGTTMARLGEFDGYLPGGRRVNQVTAVVATTTKKAAMEALGMRRTEFEHYFGETGNQGDIEKALSKPGTVFVKPLGGCGPTTRPSYWIERKPVRYRTEMAVGR